MVYPFLFSNYYTNYFLFSFFEYTNNIFNLSCVLEKKRIRMLNDFLKKYYKNYVK